MTQVTSLPLSKELWEKGLKIETEKWWINAERGHCYEGEVSWKKNSIGKVWNLYLGKVEEYEEIDFGTEEYGFEQAKELLKTILCIPAPSTDELLAVMPKTISKDNNSACFEIRLHNNTNDVCYYHPHYFVSETDKILPEALGKMCLWLLNNGYHYNPKTKMIESKGDQNA